MAKNINSLQLLRNTTQLYATKEAAISGITGSATNDGTIKLARYEVDGKNGKEIRTIFGIYSVGSGITGSLITGGSYTIYDSPQEVIAELTKRLDTLQGVDTVEGSVAKKIKDAIDALDVEAVGGTGKVITTISETNGKISATAIDLAASAVSATAISSGDTNIAVDGTTVAAQIADLAEYIGSLDYADTAVTGSYVSAVNETDGKIAVTREALPTVAEIKSEGQAIVAVKEDKGVISATAGDIAAAHVSFKSTAEAFTATTVNAALEELYSQAGAGSKVTIDKAAGTEEGVLTVYTIKQGNAEVGKINIPKDLVVTSGSVVKGNWVDGVFTESGEGTGTALKLVIANQTAPVYINTLDLVKDHTAGDGIAISDTNVVSVKRDSASEDFLTVGADGVKLSGVQNAIDGAVGTAISGLDATVSAETAHVSVTVKQVDGELTEVAVTDDDIASASALTAETSAREAEDAKIVAGVGFATGGTYSIAANTGAGESLSAASGYTVANALYTLDDAIAAAKKANTLVKADETVVVGTNDEGNTTVKVNIASAATVSNFVGYAENGSFVKSEMFAGIDAGTY